MYIFLITFVQMIEIIISEEIKNCQWGVYMIRFSDGHFYIGGSLRLQGRIKDHLRAIKSNFTSSSTCRSLRQMKGFSGSVEILLLEEVEPTENRSYLYSDKDCFLNMRELQYIHAEKSNHLLLNKTKYSYANKI